MQRFNSVHTTSREDLRELIEANFSRFDGKLAEMNGRWEGRAVAFDAKLEQRWAEFSRDLAQLESRLTWRMFAFWAPTALAVIGSGAGVISLLLRR
jgi:hypothetical protein